MKTININLLGDLHKAPEYNKAIIQKDDLDVRVKLFVVVFLVAVFVILTSSVGIWFFADNTGKKLGVELKGLKAGHLELKKEEAELQAFEQNLKDRVKLAKFKRLVKEQIESTFVPWSKVLKELATKIPRNIIVQDISKTSPRSSGGMINNLTISGVVPVKQREAKPITSVSFLLLNINESNDSYLQNAQVNSIEYDDELNAYKFEIKTNIKQESHE